MNLILELTDRKITGLYCDVQDSEPVGMQTSDEPIIYSLIIQAPLTRGSKEGNSNSQQNTDAGNTGQDSDSKPITLDGYPAYPMPDGDSQIAYVETLTCPVCGHYHSEICQFDDCGHRAGLSCVKANEGFCQPCGQVKIYRRDMASSRDLNTVLWHCGNKQCCMFGEKKDLLGHAPSCKYRS